MKTAQIATLIVLLTTSVLAWAAEPWPAEAWTAVETLTHHDPGFKKNMSGACYNPTTDVFWVCCNGGPSAFWALKKDKKGNWGIAVEGGKQARFDVGQGDLEDICQVDYRKDLVYLIAEGEDKIREYDASHYGKATLLNEWNISAHVPTKGGEGSEGITFVPDEWLKKGNFTDADGKPCMSKGGMGGLMFVAHQNGGRIYVFDLGAKRKEVRFIGSYKTSREESSGLAFDRSSGLLYIWHNTGPNYLEVATLSSSMDGKERRFSLVTEFVGPKGGNLEGIAVSPATTKDGLCLIVDDDNQDGAAIMLFKHFDFSKIPGRDAAEPLSPGVDKGKSVPTAE